MVAHDSPLDKEHNPAIKWAKCIEGAPEFHMSAIIDMTKTETTLNGP